MKFLNYVAVIQKNHSPIQQLQILIPENHLKYLLFQAFFEFYGKLGFYLFAAAVYLTKLFGVGENVNPLQKLFLQD
jgi:hypothetical protein